MALKRGTWTILIEIAIRKGPKKMKSRAAACNQPIARELKIACDVIEFAEFGKIYEFYDVTSNSELGFPAIG